MNVCFFNHSQALLSIHAFYVDLRILFVDFEYLVLYHFVNANHNHDHEN